MSIQSVHGRLSLRQQWRQSQSNTSRAGNKICFRCEFFIDKVATIPLAIGLKSDCRKVNSVFLFDDSFQSTRSHAAQFLWVPSRKVSIIHEWFFPSQICLIFFNPVDSGALQLNNDNVDMTLGRCKHATRMQAITLRQFSTQFESFFFRRQKAKRWKLKKTQNTSVNHTNISSML